jgi:ABC-type sugar transport system ATPase subunit
MAWIENALYTASDFDLKVSRWDFPDNGISCVFGESGSGKTTFLQIMAGLIPSPYRLCVKGEILSDLPVKFRNIGFVFQDYALFPHMSIYENLNFAATAKGLPQEIWKLHGQMLLEKLDLTNIKNQRASTLSGGEQQRVALARALSSLDENRRDEARDLISQLATEFKVPFILVTHDIRDVRRLAKNIILLKNGQVLGSGATDAILKNPPSLIAAKAIPENQILKIDASFNPEVSKTIPHDGLGTFLVSKTWSFQISRGANQKLKGTIISVVNEGPYLSCTVRVSSGQTLRAMAPLNADPQGLVDISYDPQSLIIFKGR